MPRALFSPLGLASRPSAPPPNNTMKTSKWSRRRPRRSLACKRRHSHGQPIHSHGSLGRRWPRRTRINAILDGAKAGAGSGGGRCLRRATRGGASDTRRRRPALTRGAGRRVHTYCLGLPPRARARGRDEQRERAAQGKDGGRRAAAALVHGIRYRAAASGSSRQNKARGPLLAARMSMRLERCNHALLQSSARAPSCRDGRSGMSMRTRARPPRPGAGGRGCGGGRAGERAAKAGAGCGADRCPPDARREAALQISAAGSKRSARRRLHSCRPSLTRGARAPEAAASSEQRERGR